jgi:hypothetical protein
MSIIATRDIDFYFPPEITHDKAKIFLVSCPLNFCHKKQENQAEIFIRFSVDADNSTCRVFVNRIPLTVN